MNNIASSTTAGPVVSAQGNRGKSSYNSQGDGEAFAKQMSENKTTKDTPSKHISVQNSKTSSINAKEDGAAVDAELSVGSSEFSDKKMYNYELKLDADPTIIDVGLHPNELEHSPDFDIASMPNSFTDVSPDKISITLEDFTSDVESSFISQEAIAALNTQLLGKSQVAQNAEVTKSRLNSENAKIIAMDMSSSLTTQMNEALKPKSENITELNKVTNGSLGAETVNSSVQNIDATKTNNTQNVDVTKLQTNTSILANMANGEGLTDQGSDNQRNGGANQFVNQVDKAGIKVEGVDVIEARVFPAISPSNGTNIADAILKTHQVGSNSALQDTDPIYNTSQPKMINTLKIQLVPANMGVVTAVMKLTGEELQVQLQVDNVEAYRKLSADSASIVSTLKNQGFGIEQVNVQLMSSDRGSAQQGQQQSGQSFQGQAQQENFSGFEQGRRDPNSTNSDEQNQDLGNNEIDVLQTPQVADLSNGVYL